MQNGRDLKREERAMLRRMQMALVAYAEARERFDSAYELMVWTRKDFENVKRRLAQGYESQVRLALAEKRHWSALEEFRYQEKERWRVKSEFEMAESEYLRWQEKWAANGVVAN
ncbi:hypothetical protein IKG20_00880 [Candidatus Saccharibacteria bacterium]|nr:hypothetical protein [Candidatus Saccharibacteria bacterium]